MARRVGRKNTGTNSNASSTKTKSQTGSFATNILPGMKAPFSGLTSSAKRLLEPTLTNPFRVGRGLQRLAQDIGLSQKPANVYRPVRRLKKPVAPATNQPNMSFVIEDRDAPLPDLYRKNDRKNRFAGVKQPPLIEPVAPSPLKPRAFIQTREWVDPFDLDDFDLIEPLDKLPEGDACTIRPEPMQSGSGGKSREFIPWQSKCKK